MSQRKKEKKPLEKARLGQNQIHTLWYFERMDQVNRAMQGTNDLEQMMKDLLDALLDIFGCDRAFLVYPCNPDHPTWQVPMERTRPEYPGVLPIGVDLPLDPVGAEVYRILRNTNGPVKFGDGEKYAVPMEMETAFNVRSFIAMAVYPKVGEPWAFGLHQCTHPRVWSSDEERLFQEIGRRLSDTLSTLLSYRSLKESEAHIKQLIDVSPVAMVVLTGEEEKVISINEKFTELFGYTIEDIPDIAHWWPLAYPDARYRDEVKAQWSEKVQKVIQTKHQIEPMEAQVTCKDGSIRYVEFQSSSIGEQHLVTFIDLTARKQAELALKERDTHSQSLLRLSRRFEQAQSYTDVLNAAQDEVEKAIGYKNLWVYLFTSDKKQANVLLAKGPLSEKVMSAEGIATIKIEGDRMMEELVKSRDILIVEDAQTDERTDKQLATRLGNRTIINVPIFLFEKYMGAVGVGTFHEEGVRIPTQSEKEYLSSLANHIAVTLDRIHLIDKRRQVEQELSTREQDYRLLVENIPDLIVRYDTEIRRVYVNPAWERSSGISAAEAINRHPVDTPKIANSANKEYIGKLQQVLTTGIPQTIEFKWENALGEVLLLEYFIVPEYDQSGKINGVLSVGRDITERKQAEDALRHSREATLHFSKQLTTLQEVTNQLSQAETEDDLTRMAVEIGRTLLEVNRMGIWFIDEKRKLMHGSFGIDEQGNLRDERNSTIPLKEEGLAWSLLSNKKPMAQIEYSSLKDDQHLKVGEGYSAQAALWDGNNVLGIISVDNLFSGLPIAENQLDILQLYANSLGYLIKRKWAEEWLRSSEKKYRALAENIPNVVFQCKNDERYTFVYLNNSIFELTGYAKEEFLEKGLSFFDLYHPEDQVKIPKPSVMNSTLINHRPYHISYRIRHRSGEWRWVDEWGTGVVNEKEDVEYIEGIMIDITNQKQYERERETIIRVSTSLRQATNRNEIIITILDQMTELLDASGAFIAIPDDRHGSVLVEMGRGPIGVKFHGMKIPQGRGASGWVISHRLPYLNNRAHTDPVFYRSDLLEDNQCVAVVPLIAHEQAIGALWLARKADISEQDLKLLMAVADIAANAIHRVTLYERTKTQLQRLLALHQIDLCITSNIELSITLKTILRYVQIELMVDAACIRLLNNATGKLEYTASIGINEEQIKSVNFGLEELNILKSLDPYALYTKGLPEFQNYKHFLHNENIESYFPFPLIVQGQIKGLLEVFHHEPLSPEQDWFDYYEALSTQTAIAIENASLIQNLHQTNLELSMAYDATIEGWSRALDMRDHETEGHTQRVTKMALKLAEQLGMSEIDKADMRRGALLHDIGKMGVPDAILHKPGDLTEIEWAIMREHPTLAYRMLSPITYLNRALDISYYHHERWDGTGYPHGLKGQEIPLAARVFAIVDVFDALTSDRPYRKAWTYEKAYQYIESQAGKHFDPEIVNVFLANK